MGMLAGAQVGVRSLSYIYVEVPFNIKGPRLVVVIDYTRCQAFCVVHGHDFVPICIAVSESFSCFQLASRDLV